MLATRAGQLGFALVLGAALACADDGLTGVAPDPPVDTAILTPEVAALLDSRGHFPAQVPESQPYATISLAAAENIAKLYMDERVDWFVDLWSEFHGAEINKKQLRRCQRPLYASSAYDFSQTDFPLAFEMYVASAYIFQYCSRTGVPQVLLSMIAREGSVPILPNGQLGFTNNIFAQGIPLEATVAPVVTPERAATLASARTARRVAAAPELVRRHYNGGFWASYWRVTLESPQVVLGLRSLDVDTISEVLVGVDPEGFAWSAQVLRGFDRATLTNRTDSLPDLSETYPRTLIWRPALLRVGMARRAEPFAVLFPPPTE